MTAPIYRIEGDVHEGTASELVTFLDANPGKVRIEINSYGGDALQGAAIFAKLGERSRDVTAFIVGVAASAASLAAMGAGKIVMHNAAHLMIHEPYTWLEGTSDQLRRAAGVALPGTRRVVDLAAWTPPPSAAPVIAARA